MQGGQFNYRAVICGVNQAAGQKALQFAEFDAQNIYAAFTSALGPTRPDTSRLLLGPWATRNNVAHALYEASQTNPDCLLFYFSGHGARNGIALADDLLEYNILYQLLELSKTKKKLVILDACQSGAFAKYGQIEVGGVEESWSVAIEQMMPGIRMFFAARSTENSNEGGGVQGGHFTWSLYQALHGGKGTLVVSEQRFLSDVDVFTSAYSKLVETWPNDARPTFKNLRGDFPMLLSHSAESPIGIASVSVKIAPNCGLEAQAAIFGRRGVPTNIICNFHDDDGFTLSTEAYPLLPDDNRVMFTRQFNTPLAPPPVAISLLLGHAVWVNAEVTLCDAFHGYVLGKARMRVPYVAPPLPSVGLR